jgi:hypothetical protein
VQNTSATTAMASAAGDAILPPPRLLRALSRSGRPGRQFAPFRVALTFLKKICVNRMRNHAEQCTGGVGGRGRGGCSITVRSNS